MADNTTLNPGVGGDTVREVEKGAAKTQVVLVDIGGIGAESLFTGAVSVSNFPATQPVSGTFFQATQPVSAAALPLPAGAATLAAQTQPGVDIGDVTINNAAGAAAVNVQDGGNSLTVDAPVGTPVFTRLSDGAAALIGQKAMVSSLPVVLASDQASIQVAATLAAETVKVIGTVNIAAAQTLATVTAVTAITNALPAGTNSIGAVTGGKTNNNAAPGATNIGALPVLANAAVPTWTEGNLVAGSADLAGAQRVILRPDVVLGSYALGGSVGYTATTANGIVFSFRWGDATRKCRITRVTVQVVATAFTTLGLVARKMVIVRGFTASDTGGTSVLPAANMGELQTAFGTTLLTDARFGGFLTAGTGTPDTNPIAIVSGWMAAVGNVIGGSNLVTLYEHRQGKKPLVFAQNEGFRVQLDAVETASTRQTFVNVEWDEGNNFE
jgi:hypothetical protein